MTGKITEQLFKCRGCGKDEWCRVYDLGYKKVVTAMVCGATLTMKGDDHEAN